MKIRSIPYGYMFKDGTVTISQEEACVLIRIFNMYINGHSLLQIAQELNTEQIEYQPGVIGWNKARIMRIIQDERYLGDSTYPSIITDDTHNQAIAIKGERNTQKNTDRSAAIFTVRTPVLCPVCNSEMHRRNDTRCKYSHRWFCLNKSCGNLISIDGDYFLSQITTVLNSIINCPSIISISDSPINPDTDIQTLENEIDRALGCTDIDKDSLRTAILDCTAMKFRKLDRTSNIGKRIKADFEKSSPLSSFSAELLHRTVESIHLSPNGTISLTLINGQYIERSVDYANYSSQ